MHAFAFIHPHVTHYVKKKAINLVRQALPHLTEKHHATKMDLTIWLGKIFSDKPREYNKKLWAYLDLQLPAITKLTNDKLYELYYGVQIPWEGLYYTGCVKKFQFPPNPN